MKLARRYLGTRYTSTGEDVGHVSADHDQCNVFKHRVFRV